MITTNTTPATYADAIRAGYRPAGTAYQSGYVSRRCDTNAQPVQIGKGSRAGQLYVLLPCWQSSRYCIRQYLAR